MDLSAIYRDSLVWDAHCDLELIPNEALEPLFAPWRQAKFDYISINASFDLLSWTQTIERIAALRRQIPLEVPYCRLVSSVDEIDQAQAEGKIAATFDIEGMNALNGRVELVKLYYDLGVRQMAIAYNLNKLAGSGCHDEDMGLTEFGAQVIYEMNRVGMVVDCSHSSYKTTMSAMERSTDPVVFSHSNAKALVDHERNITDTQIKACAETGGVVGITGVNLFLDEDVAGPSGVARHAAYVAELTGPEHVGLSMDFSPNLVAQEGAAESQTLTDLLSEDSKRWPETAGYDGRVHSLDVRHLPQVAQELVAVGFNETELIGILGGNFRRVANRVWK